MVKLKVIERREKSRRRSRLAPDFIEEVEPLVGPADTDAYRECLELRMMNPPFGGSISPNGMLTNLQHNQWERRAAVVGV
jgi:hypothetical protein